MHKNKEKKCKSNKLKSRKPYFARIKQNLAYFIFVQFQKICAKICFQWKPVRDKAGF